MVVESFRASAGKGCLSCVHLPTNSAARWLASAALPPLPTKITLDPASRACSMEVPAALTASTRPGSRNATTRSDHVSRTRLCAHSTEAEPVVSAMSPPGGDAIAAEHQFRHSEPEADQRVRDEVSALELTTEDHVTATARAGDLASQRAV